MEEEEFFLKVDEKIQFKRAEIKVTAKHPRKDIPSVVLNYSCWCNPCCEWSFSEDMYYKLCLPPSKSDNTERKRKFSKSNMEDSKVKRRKLLDSNGDEETLKAVKNLLKYNFSPEKEEVIQESNFIDDTVLLQFVAVTLKITFFINTNICYILDLEELFKTAHEEYMEKQLYRRTEQDFDQFVDFFVSYILSLPEFVSSCAFSCPTSDIKYLLISYYYCFKQAVTVDSSLSNQLFCQIILHFKMNTSKLLLILPFIHLLLLHEHRRLPIANLRKVLISCELFFKNKIKLGEKYRSTLLEIISWCIVGIYDVGERDEDHLHFRENAATFYAEVLHEESFLFNYRTSLNTFKNLLKDPSQPVYIYYVVMCVIRRLHFQAMQYVISGVFFCFKQRIEAYMNEFPEKMMVDEAVNKTEVVTTINIATRPKKRALSELKRNLTSRLHNVNISRRSVDIEYVEYYNTSINYFRFYCGNADKTIYMNSFKVHFRSKEKIVKMQHHTNTDSLTLDEKCVNLFRAEFLDCCIYTSNIFIKTHFLTGNPSKTYNFETLKVKSADLIEIIEYFKDELTKKLEFPSDIQILKKYSDAPPGRDFLDVKTYIEF